ncbi:MAG: AI-2E family transporter [Actinomycetota bacterium]
MPVTETPRLPPGERLRRVGMGAWSIIGIVIVLAMLVVLLEKIRVILPPLGLALVIIYLVNPLVTRLQRRGVPRVAGTLLSYVVVLGSITILLSALVPFVSDQVDDFSDQWPEFRTKTITFIDDTAESIEDRFGFHLSTTQADCLLGADKDPEIDGPSKERCDAVTNTLRGRVIDRVGSFTEIGRSVLEVLLIFILGPLLALYLLIDLPDLQRDMLRLVPQAHREEVSDLGNKIGRAVGGFFRGQLLIALLVGVLSAIGFRLIGLPFWLLIGAIAGFFNLIPLIGPFIGGALGFLVGTMTVGVELGIKAAIVELVVQQFDNHVLSPNIMKRTVQIHPATVMLALLAGGTIAGFWGVLLGVPAVAVLKLLVGHVWATRVLGVEPSPYASTSPAEPPSVVPAGDVAALDREQEEKLEPDE